MQNVQNVQNVQNDQDCYKAQNVVLVKSEADVQFYRELDRQLSVLSATVPNGTISRMFLHQFPFFHKIQKVLDVVLYF